MPDLLVMNGAAPTMFPVLYSFRRCPYAMRARLALAASGLHYEHREITLKNKPAEMLAASPKGTVPVLVLPDGQVIDESLDIMLWALRQNDPAHWLAPAATTLEGMLELIRVNDGAFKRNLDRYKYPNRYPQESGADTAAFAIMQRDLGARWLDGMEGQIGQQLAVRQRPQPGRHGDAAFRATVCPYRRCLVCGPTLAAAANLAGGI